MRVLLSQLVGIPTELSVVCTQLLEHQGLVLEKQGSLIATGVWVGQD